MAKLVPYELTFSFSCLNTYSGIVYICTITQLQMYLHTLEPNVIVPETVRLIYVLTELFILQHTEILYA